MPTPPVAPATAITVLDRELRLAAAEALVADPFQRRDQVLDPQRLGEKLFHAGPHRPQDQVAVGRRADAPGCCKLGAMSLSWATSCKAFSGLWSMATMPMSGCVWATTSAKNSYREHSASSQTDVHAQQRRLQRVAGSIVRIDDRQSQHIAHGFSAYAPTAQNTDDWPPHIAQPLMSSILPLN